MKRKRKKLHFASPVAVAAMAVLDDYDVALPCKMFAGKAGQVVINGAIEVEEVTITRRHECLQDRVALDAHNIAYVFVRCTGWHD